MIDMSKIKPYDRSVYYYETDRMQIVHHSNYIRWIEDAKRLMDEIWQIKSFANAIEMELMRRDRKSVV